MNAKFYLATLVLLLCSWSASAQGYDIRVWQNTNLRYSPSLSSGVYKSARAGSTLRVAGSSDRWLRIDWNGRDLWMAAWVGHSPVEDRVEENARTQSGAGTSAPIDNCCYVDRQCHSEQEWTDGYWAFQQGQCPAPSQSQTEAPAQPAESISASIDNCCYVNRQCQSDADWIDGYHAYQDNQCAAPANRSPAPASYDLSQVDNCCYVNRLCHTELDWQRGFAAYHYFQCSGDIPIRIEGSPRFVREVRAAFNLLKEKAPRLYAYGISGLSLIREVPAGSVIGVYVEERIFEYAIDLVKGDEGSIIFLAGSILHEACHVHRWEAGLREATWKEERACVEKDLEAVLALDPEDRYGNAAWYRDLIANLHKPSYWWWADNH